MNNEMKKTAYFIGIALVLLLAALVLKPRRITPDAFLDQGELLFPDFTDPNAATSLDVVTWDEQSGSAVPFKVQFKDGIWTIPSHHNYPADGKDRLAKTAAGLIDIRKDDFRTDNVSEYEQCGVVDPLDESAVLEGRGQRVTVRGANDQVLADLIIGHQVEGRPNMYFVRIPDQKRVYACNLDLDLSTSFADWIETDLLKLLKHRVDKITLKDYSINERTLSVENRDVVVLQKSDDGWKFKNAKGGQKVDSAKVETLLTTLDELKIVGVRPKPPGLSASLKLEEGEQTTSRSDLMSLQSKGYYVSRDGQLLSNEGELQVETADGVKYTLRFGEVVYGSGLSLTAGGDGESAQGEGSSENRYLFVSAQFEDGRMKPPKQPADSSFLDKAEDELSEEDKANKKLYDDYQRWERQYETNKKTARELNERFADWYYVISADSFDKLHLKRSDLVAKES